MIQKINSAIEKIVTNLKVYTSHHKSVTIGYKVTIWRVTHSPSIPLFFRHLLQMICTNFDLILITDKLPYKANQLTGRVSQ